MEAAVLVPVLIVLVSGAVLVASRSVPRPSVVAWMGLAGSAWALSSLWGHRLSAWGWVESDRLGQFLGLMILLGIALSLPITKAAIEVDVSRKRDSTPYGFVLIATAGMLLAVSTRNLLVVFISIEVVSYALLAYSGQVKLRRSSLPASVLTLSGLILFRFDSGHFDMANIEAVLLDRVSDAGVVPVFALGLFVVGVFLKVVRPLLHLKSVAVPVALTAQIALFGPLLRLRAWFLVLNGPLELMLTLVGFISMFVGNLWALSARDWKGVLKASFLVHLGFLALGLTVDGEVGRASVLLYLFALVVMGVGAWTAIGSAQSGELEGRGWDNRFRGFAMGLFCFSLAGIPLTMGFTGRLHLLSALVRDVHLGLVVLALLNLLVCFYYYGKVFLVLFSRPASENKDESAKVGKGVVVSLLVCALVVVVIGVWPEPCLSLVRQVAAEFF